MVWALVFVLVTTSVAETWDTGMRFDTLENCRRSGSALAEKFVSGEIQRLEKRRTGEIRLSDWEWSCLPREPAQPSGSADLASLRSKALAAGGSAPNRGARETKQSYYERSKLVRDYVLQRAD